MDGIDSPIGVAIIISILYIILSILENKFISKEKSEFKKIFRGVIIVFLSILLGNYLLTLTKTTITKNTNVFVDNPTF
jgi:hypothetical protein